DPTINVKLEKSTPLNKAPRSGIIISSTNEETIFPNAAPIITATAKSNTFPSKANFLKSSHIFLHLIKYVIVYDCIWLYQFIQPIIIFIKTTYVIRSEERRVGKESRYQWWQNNNKMKRREI